MATLSESALRRLIAGGETATVELKVASPRPVEMAERLCGMANARGGVVIIGVEDAERRIVGVPNERLALTKDVILRATRQIIKPALILDPPEPEVSLIDGTQLVVGVITFFRTIFPAKTSQSENEPGHSPLSRKQSLLASFVRTC